ncbi:pyridoxamine 5'-phosphate oxidase family protein [Streptomyces phaeoluteigriseus]|uniref:Pyridoxamine 5'-phosphate oxidase family protein n=1 Tax=Streptomyces phaeoluteigriseus TaxID=114686 RepID=A0ABY4ZBU5_9ACTN|nr:pyridoxamine 5'-phosphate oxidase family protein [Streptomyces phaeoluteigriseus]USQ86484.1 pyridoxamine 5'-phosphate oxidase family protein [Streptomyces phaeoluteigriseus]
MEIIEPLRGPRQRRADVLDRLEGESDIWVATAGPDGVPCLVALWFVWDGECLWLSTRLTNPTGRNLRDGGRARLAFGDTRDVVLIDGDVTAYAGDEVPASAVEAFAAKTGWDPRSDGVAYAFFRVRPRDVQAWREERELRGRHVMREGVWAV